MIRILQVVTHMDRGGLETMLMNYYRHIDREKVQFDFLVHRSERGDYDDEIEALGGRIYRIGRLVPWSGAYKKQLRDFFAGHPEYRAVHVHQDCLSGVILREAKAAGVTVRIAHSHSSSQDRDIKYPIKLYYRRNIPKYATELFACGNGAGQWMFRGAPFRVVANAIDAGLYVPDEKKRAGMREAFGIDPGAVVIGHVGRFSPAKNHLGLIGIFEEILKRKPEAALLLVGDDSGELADRVKALVKEKGLEGSVIFTGLRSDVADVMQAMDVFVMPSLYEGLPVTLVEAQASGLTCIISDRVPPECDITGLCNSVSLDAPAGEWADAVLGGVSGHEMTYEKIVSAGYDIAENAKWLEEYYEEAVKCSEK